MTAVNAALFNDHEGGMVVDEQSSNEFRKYNLAIKLHTLSSAEGVHAIYGGSGASSLLGETAKLFEAEYSKKRGYNLRDLAKGLTNTMSEIKREKIELRLKSAYGMNGLNVVTGKAFIDGQLVPIDPSLAGRVQREYTPQEEKMYENAFIMVGEDRGGAEMYVLTMDGDFIMPTAPYACIGSGSDESDKVLSNFFKIMEREKRNRVELIEGMTALIRATNAASEVNQGVGGAPMIAYFGDKGTITLKEKESRLASEIVKALDASLIGPEKAKEGLMGLLVNEDPFRKVNDEVFKGPDYEKISEFLRGYKQ